MIIYRKQPIVGGAILLLLPLLMQSGCSAEPAVNTVPPTRVAATNIEPRSLSNSVGDDELMRQFVPSWVADAVFYQIFPERFHNGDPANDPTRESLEPSSVSSGWEISPWTGDWYSRAEWEKKIGGSFYDAGVFHRRYGGDLQGVFDKLDYLQELGINAIYFNPVFYGRSLHKYDSASMHHIDPYFGPDPEGDLKLIAAETSDAKQWHWTSADKLFLQLVREIHKRGMRVIIDGVFNHTGQDFFAFADLREKQEKSAYKDWYIVQHFDNPETPHNEFHYKGWWGIHTLPEFADSTDRTTLHDGPRQYVLNITRRWMDPDGDGDPSDGIDGWRLDVANEVPSGFWQEWNSLVRELNPEAYTVGEFWGDARQQLIDGRFSATMNYHGFAYPVKGYLIDGRLTPHDFAMQLRDRMAEYPESMQYALQNLVDSHDTDRVASMIVNANAENYRQPEKFDYDVSEVVSPRYHEGYDVGKPTDQHRKIQRLVALMQMTFAGPPMVYYGTESGMWGADDPCNRQPMVWRDLDYDSQSADPLDRLRAQDSVEFDESLFEYYKRAIALRNTNPVLRRGAFEVISFDDDAQSILFRRHSSEKQIFVAINRGAQSCEFTIEHDGRSPLEVLFTATGGEEDFEIHAAKNQTILSVPSLNAVVLGEGRSDEK